MALCVCVCACVYEHFSVYAYAPIVNNATPAHERQRDGTGRVRVPAMWLWFALLAACAACCVANKEIDTEMEWVYDIVPEALKWNMTHTGLK